MEVAATIKKKLHGEKYFGKRLMRRSQRTSNVVARIEWRHGQGAISAMNSIAALERKESAFFSLSRVVCLSPSRATRRE